MVLNAIYEGDFVGFSYGFRPRTKTARWVGRTFDSDQNKKGELDT
jgi:hypothetical protein